MEPKGLTHEQQISYWGIFPPIIQFAGLIVGVLMEYIFPTRMFPPALAQTVGVVLLALGSVLVLWAQKTSAAFRAREKKGETRVFHKGPYRWFHNPTSFGLALMVIGFGFVLNSLMIVLLSAVGYWLSYIVYEERKQRIMAEKYQDDYAKYKHKVKTIF